MTRNPTLRPTLLAALVAAAATCVTAPAALAQPGATSASAPAASGTRNGTVVGGDRRFLERAAESGMAELELSRLAQQHAADAQVKAFADRMVTDHSKTNDEVMRLAQARGVNLPGTPPRSVQRDVEKMGKRTGGDFDRDYMRRMVADHRKAVSEFQGASRGAKDADIKSFAERTLPALQEHLTMAQSTVKTLRGGRSASGAAAGASR